jgi:predicted enzyme related to lactoylglutathione lyase
MNIKRMDLAWISVKDIQQSQKFFGETLGLTITSSTPEYGWLEVMAKEGGCLLGIGQGSESDADESPVKPGSNAVLTMTVDDIVAAKKELEGKSVRVIGDIIEVPGHVKMITFADPDGNIFQLVQDLSK